MKKLLSIILVFIIFFTFIISASAGPPRQIIIRSEEELAEMRIMAESDEEKLQDYLRRMNYRINGLRTREAVVAF
jgi:hypothetical protein